MRFVAVLVVGAVSVVGGGCGSADEPKKRVGAVDASASAREPKAEVLTGEAIVKLLSWDNPDGADSPIDDRENGPWVDEVWLSGGDAPIPTTVGKNILDHASAPSLIELADGTLVIYANDGTQRSESGLLVAVSTDDGKTWTSGSVQFEAANDAPARPGGQRGDVEAVKLKNGGVRMYYMHPGRQGPAIGSATTTDGVNFVEDEGDRFDPGVMDTILEADVIQLGDGTWRMYAGEQTPLESGDGVNFEPVTQDYTGEFHTDSVREGDTFYQYRCAGGSITLYSSSDGYGWKAGGRLPETDESIQCDPSGLHRSDGSWLLAFKRQAKMRAPGPA